MNCNEVVDALNGDDAALDPAKRQAISEHVRGCEPCRTLWNELARLDTVSEKDADYEKDPPALQEKIRARAHAVIDERNKPKGSSSVASIVILVLVGALGIAAGILVERRWHPVPETQTPAPKSEWEIELRDLDVQTAELLHRNGRLDQAKVLAEHALKQGHLSDQDKQAAEEILRKK